MGSSPVETQNTSLGVLDDRGLVLDAEVLEGRTLIEPAPIELSLGAITGSDGYGVLEIASRARRLDWLRVG